MRWIMDKPTIAIVGASANRSKFGNKAVRAYLRQGYQVYPINPRAEIIEGLPAYRSIADVPHDRLDRVSIYLPPAVGMQVIEEVARKPPGEVWLNPGAESPELIATARRLGLNVVVGCSIVAIGELPDD
jgi:predicted CoA-binding protein